MNPFKKYRDANAGSTARRRKAQKAKDAADEEESLERYEDDGGSWIDAEQCEEPSFKMGPLSSR